MIDCLAGHDWWEHYPRVLGEDIRVRADQLAAAEGKSVYPTARPACPCRRGRADQQCEEVRGCVRNRVLECFASTKAG
jgi:hypothetical protein